MTAALEPVTTVTTAPPKEPVGSPGRLRVLDILRGCAILGMVVVHFWSFNPGSKGGGSIGAATVQAIRWLAQGKAVTTFAILFGVGFAIQLRRADARGGHGGWHFLRRLLGVAVFGVLAGTLQLIMYASSGVWLLLVRRWSTRRLLAALLVSASLWGVWNLAVGSYQWATLGTERANSVYQSPRQLSPAMQAASAELAAATAGTNFLRLAKARISATVVYEVGDLWGDWQRRNAGLVLTSLAGALPLLLAGVLALRLGVFDRPDQHHRLLVAVMLVGVAWWAVCQFGLYRALWPVGWVIPSLRVAAAVQTGLGLFQYADLGLAAAYIAAVTLLVSSSETWKRRLAALFGAAGRMALTNYLLQFVVLGIVFDNYAFGAKQLTPQLGLAAAFLLFGALTVFSRWWLARFRFGPAEWVLRSLTYARLQPFRRPAAQPA